MPSIEDIKRRSMPVGKVRAIEKYLENQEGGGTDVTWEDVQDKPTTFPPSSHNHPISQVTGLQDALDSKIESVTWGDVTGKPSTFPPAAHTHTIADIDTLQSTLNDLESRLAALESAGE